MRPSIYFLTRRRLLFEVLVTAACAGWTLLLSGVADRLAFASTLPAPLTSRLLLATLGWLARRGTSPVLRGGPGWRPSGGGRWDRGWQ